jgi:uncharacterized protein YndB with AHSA1/START domain
MSAGEQGSDAGGAVRVSVLQIDEEVMIDAPPERVFDALTTDVSAWWGEPHMYDEARARDIRLEPVLGGEFYEDWGNGEGAVYATVTLLHRPEHLRLSGPMGMSGAVAAVIDFRLYALGRRTTLRLSHRAVGEIPEETQAGYRDGWRTLLAERLKGYVERGIRSGLKR